MLYSTTAFAPDGDFALVAVFAPTRTRILSVYSGRIRLRAVGHNPFTWHGHVPGSIVRRHGVAQIHVDAIGERPVLLRLQTSLTGQDAEGLHQLRDGVVDWIALLNDRASVCAPHNAIRRFFFYFDAWTTPELARALRGDGFVKGLSDAARATFLPSPANCDPSGLFVGMANELVTLALSRAHNLAHGLPTTPTPKTCTPENIASVARYLVPIFARVPRRIGAELHDHLLDDVEAAFTYFATGHLAFLKCDPDDGFLNAEPNSQWFFALAEFAFRAYEFKCPPSRGYWFRLARLFTVLIEPFGLVYGPVLSGRGACGYSYTNRRDAARPAIPDVMRLISLQSTLIPESDGFQKLELLFAATMLWAVRDDAIQSHAVCKLRRPRLDSISIAARLQLSVE